MISICFYEYSYDEYGNKLGYTLTYGDTVEEYEYIEALREDMLIKRTVGDNVTEESVYEDLDGVLTKHNKETSGSGEATLSLEAAYYATNTTSNSYYRYNRVINVTSDMPASAGGIKFEIKRDADNDDRITEINSTYNGALIEFLNIKYEYTGDRNTKTYIKRKGQEEIFDEYGNRIEIE